MYAATHIAGLWAGILWGHWIFLFRLWAAPTRWQKKMLRALSSLLGGAVEICALIATPFLKYLRLMMLDWSWRKKEFGLGQYVEPWGAQSANHRASDCLSKAGGAPEAGASRVGCPPWGLPLHSPSIGCWVSARHRHPLRSRAEGQGCGCLRQLCNTTGPASDSPSLSSC